MSEKHKIGIGVVTCNREESFKKCVKSLPNVDSIIVVNSGDTPYKTDSYDKKIKDVIVCGKKIPVGHAKNKLFRALIDDGCKSIFIAEDDITIKNDNVCEKYIKTAESTGIWNLISGCGRFNFNNQTGQYIVKNIVEYEDGTELYLYHNTMAFWTYYLAGVIKNVGYFNEIYINAMEHVDHSYRCVQRGLISAYWWWPDIAKSWEYINNPETNDLNSQCQKNNEDWKKNFNNACIYFKQKYGYYPTEVPEISKEEVLNKLEIIQKNYAKKVL